MAKKLKKITEILVQCSNFRCCWIGQVGECVPDALVVPDTPNVLLAKKEFEGLLRCPKCSSVVNQIGEG